MALAHLKGEDETAMDDGLGDMASSDALELWGVYQPKMKEIPVAGQSAHDKTLSSVPATDPSL